MNNDHSIIRTEPNGRHVLHSVLGTEIVVPSAPFDTGAVVRDEAGNKFRFQNLPYHGHNSPATLTYTSGIECNGRLVETACRSEFWHPIN